jgi:uncharacterized DUF497 family protein
MRFVWDSSKDALNQRKHGLSLADAIPALEDLGRTLDRRPIRLWEVRTVTAGRSGGQVLIVVSTERDRTEEGEESTRIISVRRPKRYEEDWFNFGRA